MASKASGLTLNDQVPLLSVATLSENLAVLIYRTLMCFLCQSTIFPPLNKECTHSFRTSNTVITLLTTQIVPPLLVIEYKKQCDRGYKLGCENTSPHTTHGDFYFGSPEIKATMTYAGVTTESVSQPHL
jgi:hypothetical protein